MQQLAQQGTKDLYLIAPGFAVDCLETIEELAITNKKLFQDAGGEQLHYIPALNDSDSHAKVMMDLIKHETTGWPETDSGATSITPPAETKTLAVKLGAEK